jgi:hypothetical protein
MQQISLQYTAITIKVVPVQRGKSNTNAKGLLGIAKKINYFFSDSLQAFDAPIRLFRFARGQP